MPERQQQPEPSRTVPGLPHDAASQIESNLGGNRQNALDILAKTLSDRGDINLSSLTGEKMTLYRIQAGWRRATMASPPFRRAQADRAPCRVEVGPDAFRSVGDLYATVMHEWLHVLQFRPGDRPLKRIVAEQALDNRVLKDLLSRNF